MSPSYRSYITDETKVFVVREEYVGERFPRYYISRLNEGKRYLYASMGQEKCAALFLCKLLNENIDRLVAFELEYYKEDEDI